jgi:hypothetical protein
MFKSIPLGACVVFMAVLIGTGAVSTRAGRTSHLLPSTWSSITILADQGGDNKDQDSSWSGKEHDWWWDKDHDWWAKDHDRRKHQAGDPAPSPSPEPSTLLSFGAALIIGGGVLLLGRLRKERK